MPVIVAAIAAFIFGYFLAALLSEWKRQDLEIELVNEIHALERALARLIENE
jgi:hypothetical protein